MKRLVLAALVALVLGFAPNAHALPLIDNGGNLIYDPGQNITWYDFTYGVPTSAYWSAAMDWAANLNVGGVTGWRLPTTPGAATYNSFTSEGEMGELRDIPKFTVLASESLNPADSLDFFYRGHLKFPPHNALNEY